MQRVVNHLVQLQELVLIREQEAFMGGERLKELDESISAMTEQLPTQVRGMFTRLQKKDPVAVVPIAKGVCSTCGMKLPISLVQAVRAEKQVHHCPNCTRILYYADSPPRSVAKKQLRGEPRKTGIERFSSAELMIPRLEAKTTEDAIAELAHCMETELYVEHSDKLVEAALRREAIITTSVDHGLAFPHVRGVEGGGLSLSLGMSPKGIRFDQSARTLTRIVFFIVIPTAANAFYLRLLAGLAETFVATDARKKLMAETTPTKVWKTLKRLTRKTIP